MLFLVDLIFALGNNIVIMKLTKRAVIKYATHGYYIPICIRWKGMQICLKIGYVAILQKLQAQNNYKVALNQYLGYRPIIKHHNNSFC